MRYLSAITLSPFRPTRCLHPHGRVQRVRSLAEHVYSLESQLTRAGFTSQQARSLLVTGSRLSDIRRKLDFQQIKSVFEASWEIEDELVRHGMDRKKARHMGCMFVALAATQFGGKGKGYNCDDYWNFWETSAAEDAGNCLEAAGVRKHKGYMLAKSMLTFMVLEKRKEASS